MLAASCDVMHCDSRNDGLDFKDDWQALSARPCLEGVAAAQRLAAAGALERLQPAVRLLVALQVARRVERLLAVLQLAPGPHTAFPCQLRV